MTATWLGIVLTALGCYTAKVVGVSVPERVLDHPLTQRTAALIPVALLGALVGVQASGGDAALELDARLAGLGAAAALLALRVPFLPVVVTAAVVAALVRLV